MEKSPMYQEIKTSRFFILKCNVPESGEHNSMLSNSVAIVHWVIPLVNERDQGGHFVYIQYLNILRISEAAFEIIQITIDGRIFHT